MFTKIIEQIDYYLDHITMYRLVLYVLIVFIVAAAIFGIFGLVPFSFISIIFSATFLVFISWLTNNIFSIVFKAPTNIESVFITSLILALIITPFKSANGLIFLAWAAIWGTASKYIFAIGKKHIFNPAAVAVLLTSMVIGQAASWWIGTKYFIPFVFLGGILIVRKIRKIDMVYSLIMTVLITTFIFAVSKNLNVFTAFNNILFNSSLFFFAFVMFTEPLTSPPTKNLQIIYGILVGILFTPQFHIGGLYFTPELALICGNVFSYLVSPKYRLHREFTILYLYLKNLLSFLRGNIWSGRYPTKTPTTEETEDILQSPPPRAKELYV
jgi:Na+-transporting NADH:ubiquinone oxidoreductase subunit NqrB